MSTLFLWVYNYVNMKPAFSRNLIRLRKEKGLSQKKLAELSGLTERAIGYYEKELQDSPIANIEAIANALAVSLEDLLGEKMPTQIQDELSQIDTRTLGKLKLILSLPNSERHVLYNIAESFIAKRKLNEIEQPEKIAEGK